MIRSPEKGNNSTEAMSNPKAPEKLLEKSVESPSKQEAMRKGDEAMLAAFKERRAGMIQNLDSKKLKNEQGSENGPIGEGKDGIDSKLQQARDAAEAQRLVWLNEIIGNLEKKVGATEDKGDVAEIAAKSPLQAQAVEKPVVENPISAAARAQQEFQNRIRDTLMKKLWKPQTGADQGFKLQDTIAKIDQTADQLTKKANFEETEVIPDEQIEMAKSEKEVLKLKKEIEVLNAGFEAVFNMHKKLLESNPKYALATEQKLLAYEDQMEKFIKKIKQKGDLLISAMKAAGSNSLVEDTPEKPRRVGVIS